MTGSSTALLTHDLLAEASERLTPLPAAANRLTTMLADDDVDLRAVVNIVTYDPMLTAVLLRQANSAHAGFVRPTSTVNEAVVRLGLGAVASIAMRTAVAQSLQRSLPVYGLESRDVLDHSIKTAVAADVLRARCPARVPAAASTVALLHDVGKILISEVLGSRAIELVCDISEAEGVSLVEAEVGVFGLHHGQAGVHAIRRWELPLSFVEAMASHHCPPGEVGALATAVRVADELAHAIDHPGEDSDDNFTGAVPRRASIALSDIGVDEQHHLQVLVDVEKRYEWVQGLMAA
jgi:putative nucleotidyltransferase with HDIG domain